MTITLIINGESRNVETEVNETLLSVLRRLGLHSVKFGCGEGTCGACVVLLDGEPVNSCCVLAARAHCRSITTVEGLGEMSAPHPLQAVFVEHGAVQCGYSTPGTILAAYALLARNPDPTDEEIKRAIDGNLCRCTGYVKRVEAIKAAIAVMKEAGR
ncbi:(2Fe-2S)-binding protein [bacterium]|nr:(2Fe-2S)-binding protein [candidate division CSSED10-310 bacterium]